MRDTLPIRVRFGEFGLNVRTGELRQNERTILLQEQPFRVLLMLIDSRGEAVTREEMRKKLWPNDTVVEFDQGINAAIRDCERRSATRRTSRITSKPWRGVATG